MKKVCVVTATRAEYGLLKPLIERMLRERCFQTQVVATGTHLSEDFGFTCQEIEQDGIPITRKIPILTEGDTEMDVSLTMANALKEFAQYFEGDKPDFLILLGDRTEILAIACAAMNARIPIAHIHGGELTQGVVDDYVRHSLTKMSYLHFASTERYRRRIIQMGESPDHVFNVGALGVENVLKEPLLSRIQLKEELEFPVDKDYAVVTYHPVTLEPGTALQQVDELIHAMEQNKQYYYLITKSNADAGGRQINKRLEQAVFVNPNMKLVASLGRRRYLSAVKYASFVMGNSSSGIIEVPALGVPAINIGDRERGRMMGNSILQCEPKCEEICQAMEQTKQMCNRFMEHPYGDGTASEQIVTVLKKYLLQEQVDLKKYFYDLEWAAD